jgi:hypothetical protein
MEKKNVHFRNIPSLLALALLLSFGTFAKAQSNPAQGGGPAQDTKSAQDRDNNNNVTQDVRDNDITRGELAQFDQFLDSHPEISDQLRRDPSLVNNPDFVKNHPALQTYLQDHPGVRDQLRDNPNAFMRQEDNFDRREDTRDRDTRLEQLAQFNQFLDSHREIAEQLRRDPSLADNPGFVKTHPALQTYLQDHPGVRDQLKDNPSAFMHQEDNFDRRQDTRDRDLNRDQLASFREFLGSHASIAQQLSKDPSLIQSHDYVQSHAELQAYLKANPGVQEQFMKDPQAFAQPTQQPGNNSGQYSKAPTFDSKPKP